MRLEFGKVVYYLIFFTGSAGLIVGLLWLLDAAIAKILKVIKVIQKKMIPHSFYAPPLRVLFYGSSRRISPTTGIINPMRKLINFLDLEFNAIQYKWGRKLFKGTFYLIRCTQLGLSDFWSTREIESCQSKTVKTEKF